MTSQIPQVGHADNVKGITVLGQGIKLIAPVLKDALGLSDDELANVESISEIREINPTGSADNLGESGYKFQEEDGRLVLVVDHGKAVANKVRVEIEKGTERQHFISEQKEKEEMKSLSDDEEASRRLLGKVDDILERMFGRRTSTSSWVLKFVLNKLGLLGKGEDDISHLSKILKDTTFIKHFTKYNLERGSDSYKAKKELEKALGDDENKEQKVKLAELASVVLGFCKKVPAPLVTAIPVAFAIQNISMPILANIVKEGPLGKLFDFLRMVNPWVGDFLAEPLGLFKTEILGSKTYLHRLDNTEQAAYPLNNVTDSIKVSPLSDEELRLQRMVGKVNDAFERLFGKGTTLSSWILIGLLKLRSPSKNFGALFKDFAQEYVNNPEFIRELCKHYKDVNEQSKKQGGDVSVISENKMLRDRFNKSNEQWFVARIFSGITSIAKNLDKNFIENTTKKFGLFYCTQYLFMPIITKLIGNKSLFGKLLGLVRDINPFINDLIFDPIATFQTEIRGIKKESENVPDLIPEAHIGKIRALENVVEYGKSLFNTIRKFGARTIRRGAPEAI